MSRRLEDLLIERAVSGLDARREAELERMLARAPEVDADAYDRAAAVLHLALLDHPEPMPGDLARRVGREAETFTRREQGG